MYTVRIDFMPADQKGTYTETKMKNGTLIRRYTQLSASYKANPHKDKRPDEWKTEYANASTTDEKLFILANRLGLL